MIFVKTFKGYKPTVMDESVNNWILANKVDVGDIKTTLSHEPGAQAGLDELMYVVLYKADKPIKE
jgi:hypothetical protein